MTAVTLHIQDQSFAYDPAGAFDETIILGEGEILLQIYAEDAAGNPSETIEIPITVDTSLGFGSPQFFNTDASKLTPATIKILKSRPMEREIGEWSGMEMVSTYLSRSFEQRRDLVVTGADYTCCRRPPISSSGWRSLDPDLEYREDGIISLRFQ